jgi:hypothetical protein
MVYNEGESLLQRLLHFFLFGEIMREATYQANLIKKLQKMFPGCFILKNDPSVNQGVPDLLILFKDKWAMLEVKQSETSPERPNQPYFVKLFNKMSFASFIHPKNEKQVLHDLQSTFGANRKARVS